MTSTNSTNTPKAARARRRGQSAQSRPRRQLDHKRAVGASARVPALAPAQAIPELDLHRLSEAEKDAVWAMSPKQRVEAMWGRRFSMSEMTYWSGCRPDEVPRIGNEYAFIARFDPEYCEPSRPASELRP